MSVLVRLATKDDRVFIENTWTRSYERYAMLASRDPLRYRRFFPSLIECLMLEDGCEARLAVDETEPDVFLAFACFKGPELHYLYVKQAVRKLGIVPRLLEGVDVRYMTFRTDACEERLRASARGWEYRPRLEV